MRTVADNLSPLEGIRHGFFSSRNGVSTGLYQSLNCGQGSSDNPDHIAQNRQRVAGQLGVEADHLISPYQVHSATALIVDEPWPLDREKPKLDALVTRSPGLAIGILTADCAPVLFCDPVVKVIGAAHAGWRGAFGGVLDHTIEQMCRLGAEKSRIIATVGPAISVQAYEVGDEFRDHFLREDASNEQFFSFPDGAKKVHFDLQAYAKHRLLVAGIENTAIVPHCTYRRDQQYFSYRRSQRKGHTDYGRQISAIVIE